MQSCNDRTACSPVLSADSFEVIQFAVFHNGSVEQNDSIVDMRNYRTFKTYEKGTLIVYDNESGECAIAGMQNGSITSTRRKCQDRQQHDPGIADAAHSRHGRGERRRGAHSERALSNPAHVSKPSGTAVLDQRGGPLVFFAHQFDLPGPANSRAFSGKACCRLIVSPVE